MPIPGAMATYIYHLGSVRSLSAAVNVCNHDTYRRPSLAYVRVLRCLSPSQAASCIKAAGPNASMSSQACQ